MFNRKFWIASGTVALAGGVAAAALAYVPYLTLTTFTGADLVMMGPKSSSQVYAYDGDFLTGHMPPRTLAGTPNLPGTPALTFCGSGTPAITGSDGNGTITTGTSATTCHATFAKQYVNAPNCVVTWQTNIASMVYTISNGGFTVTQTSESGNKLNYVCMANAGG